MSVEKEIFEPTWLAEKIKATLEKTGGALEWDYELINSIPLLAENAPEDTLIIARLHLLINVVRSEDQHQFIRLRTEWLEAFEILYTNLPDQTTTLINELTEEGGQPFWQLTEVLQDDP